MSISSVSSDSSWIGSSFGGSHGKAESSGIKELSAEEKKEVAKLQSQDQEVRSHEAAHVAAGGQYVRGGASFSYQNGPDGKKYAVGGEVSIDTSAVKGDPKATIQKMQTVQRAALAPANPSGQDRAVAGAAAAAAATAQQQLNSGGQPGAEKTGGDGATASEKNSRESFTLKTSSSTYSKNGITHQDIQSKAVQSVIDITA
jgi:hypothetical protein